MRRLVCFFTDTVGFGGAEQALLTLAAGLDRATWEPVLIFHPSPGVEPLLSGARAQGLRLLPVSPMPDGLTGARRLLPFARQLRRLRPAVFHAHLVWPLACKYALMAAILARVPAIVATQQLFVQFRLDASIYAQQRLVAAGIGRYLPVSRDLAARLRERLHIPATKLQVIHNSINTAAYEAPADPALQARLSPAGRPVVLCVARLDAQKGHRHLLAAAASVPQAQIVLAGDGPERTALRRQAAELGLQDRVTFLGYRADVAALLAASDICVLPSLYEGLPLAVLEAMAARKPVVATHIGGTTEAITSGETGLLVPPADPAALAQSIRTLLSDPALAANLSAAGYAHVRDSFSAARMVQQVTGVYTELLAARDRLV